MLDVVGFEGKYKVTSCGKVWSVRSQKFLKPRVMHDGYIQYVLYQNGVPIPFQAHRIVAQAFIPNPLNLPFVNHKDEVKDHNFVQNLEWCTREYNRNYGTAKQRAREKLQKPVRCVDTGETFVSFKEAERCLNLRKGYIANCFFGNIKHPKYNFELL